MVSLALLLQPEIPDRVCAHRSCLAADWVSISLATFVTHCVAVQPLPSTPGKEGNQSNKKYRFNS